MAKREISAKHVFSLFKGLTEKQQEEFLRLCLNDLAENSIRWLFERESLSAFEGEIAKVDLIHAERALQHQKRKPKRDADDDIIRLREKEELTFGQIEKRLKLNSATAARQRYNRAKKRQKTELRRQELERESDRSRGL
jgi:hypothetical protein